MHLRPRLSRDSQLLTTNHGWHLRIPSGPAGLYRLAQMDDQSGLPRPAYLHRPPITLAVRARVSQHPAPGTWGFGFWNDPSGFSWGPGATFVRLPALPQAAWFFCASPRCYLSFRDDKPGQGFYAQAFRSPRFDARLIPAALTLPLSPKLARRKFSQIIREDSAAVRSDPTEWHSYRILWTGARAAFHVDEDLVLETSISPSAPLGLVLWIDNQFAGFSPQGRLSWGTEKNPDPVWLEIEDLQIAS